MTTIYSINLFTLKCWQNSRQGFKTFAYATNHAREILKEVLIYPFDTRTMTQHFYAFNMTVSYIVPCLLLLNLNKHLTVLASCSKFSILAHYTNCERTFARCGVFLHSQAFAVDVQLLERLKRRFAMGNGKCC